DFLRLNGKDVFSPIDAARSSKFEEVRGKYLFHCLCVEPDVCSPLRRSRLFGQLPGKNKLKASSRLLVSPFPEIKIIPCCCGVLSLARSGGDRRSRLSTNSQHLLGMASGGQCPHCRRLTEVGLVGAAPARV